MGMDVYGHNPARTEGQYFRRNVWSWHPLADLCNDMAPDICAECEDWHSNGGDGLGSDAARALAKVLRARLADGTVSGYIDAREKSLAALPDEPCSCCKSDGPNQAQVSNKRPEEVFLDFVTAELASGTGECGRCNGSGKRRPMACNYSFDADDVREFADFLEACGGFEIC